MHDHRGPKLMLFLATVFLVVGAAAFSEEASAASKCITTCKGLKAQCVNRVKGEFATAKQDCITTKSLKFSFCETIAADKRTLKQCKKAAKGDFKRCKKVASKTFKQEKKRGCVKGFRQCKKCCKGNPEKICPISQCGDSITVEGEDCDGSDDDACPGRCMADCMCLPKTTTTITAVVPTTVLAPTTTAIRTTTTSTTATPATTTTTTTAIGATTTSSTTTTTTTVETTTTTTNCDDCCDLQATRLEATVVKGSGICGTAAAFRCSQQASAACVDDSDCTFGTCYIAPPFCSGDVSISCSADSDCEGTCEEVVALNLPMDLECGGLYTGGGRNSVPLPFSIPDTNKLVTKVSDCNPATGEFAMTGITREERNGDNLTCTEGRKCKGGADAGTPCVLDSDCQSADCEDRCLFGAPLPVPNRDTAATSVCTINVVAEDVLGTGTCDGDSEMVARLRSEVYLNGDLLKSSTPPDVPGIQACPLCDTLCHADEGALRFPCRDSSDCPGGCSNDPTLACFADSDCDAGGACNSPAPATNTCGVSLCLDGPRILSICTSNADCLGGTCAVPCVGGPNSFQPCTSDSDCPDGTCGTQCLGGLDDGTPCRPMTSDTSVLGEGFPTSHDCRNDEAQNITSAIGGLPVALTLTTGFQEVNAVDRRIEGTSDVAKRNFCAYCRDVAGQGSQCFEGDTDPGCPPAQPVADGNAVPCNEHADCADGDEYESCVQKNAGAFGESGVTTVNMEGTPAECLANGGPNPVTTVGIFCIPPTFNATIDQAGDLPGPGAVSVQANAQLVP